jgi:hypothetical protein
MCPHKQLLFTELPPQFQPIHQTRHSIIPLTMANFNTRNYWPSLMLKTTRNHKLLQIFYIHIFTRQQLIVQKPLK